MDWKKLISNKRLGQEARQSQRHDGRSEFKRDYDRIIFSAPFRRMQNKTQVFPLPGSIFVHNRLTHSLEVASVGKSLGDGVMAELLKRHPELRDSFFEEIGTIVSSACLAHDMGNPPFGHSGEKAIQAYFTDGGGAFLKGMVSSRLWSDVIHFEGNANAFRLLAHQFKGRREGGFVMTYTTLASIVKYPFSSESAGPHGKFGFFYPEEPLYGRIAEELGLIRLEAEGEPARYARHPLVYLVEAADDICYEIMDIEDAHKLRILSYEETRQLLLGFFDEETRTAICKRMETEGVDDVNEQVVYMRSCAIGTLTNACAQVFIDHEDEILAGSFQGSLIKHTPAAILNAYKKCTETSCKKIYNSKPVLDVELSGYRIIQTLMEQMVNAVVYPERFYSRQLIQRVSSQYDISSDSLDDRIMAVVDYISGMTDVYALDIYQKINGISLPIV